MLTLRFAASHDPGVYWQHYSHERPIMLIVRILIFALLAAILISLFSALGYLIRNKGPDREARVAKALTLRIGLSLSLFLLLMVAFYFGLLPSNGHP